MKKAGVDKSAINLKEVKPKELSEIEVSYWIGKSRITDYHEILTIRYSGEYGFGSIGNSDAQYMYAKGEFGLNCYEPMGAILDLTKLSYKWGDMMDLVFSIGSNQYAEADFPMALVIGKKCQEAIGTLIHGVDSTEPATTKDWIFTDFEKAWAYVEEKMEELEDII